MDSTNQHIQRRGKEHCEFNKPTNHLGFAEYKYKGFNESTASRQGEVRPEDFGLLNSQPSLPLRWSCWFVESIVIIFNEAGTICWPVELQFFPTPALKLLICWIHCNYIQQSQIHLLACWTLSLPYPCVEAVELLDSLYLYSTKPNPFVGLLNSQPSLPLRWSCWLAEVIVVIFSKVRTVCWLVDYKKCNHQGLVFNRPTNHLDFAEYK